MVGAASLAAACLSVVIGAISQGFGGVYQDRRSFADYSAAQSRPLPAVSYEQKGPDYDPVDATARAERGRGFHRPGRYRPECRVSGVLVNVGRKLGLYQAMADLGAGTSVALAA